MRPHLLAAMALAALPLAQPPDAEAQRRMRFQAMDANGDGVITRAEWRGSEQSFRVHDWNGDRRLSGDEVSVGGVRRRQDDDFDESRRGAFDEWTPEGFRSHDHNGDGRITRDEWHYDVESFRRADRNGDGVLTRNEFVNADPDADREDRFEYLDANGNGRVERSEWHASADAFEWLDRNGDGVLSRSEVVGEHAEEADTFSSLDVNRDGRISMNEWHWSRRSFERRDRNGDGHLTRGELGSLAGGTPGATGTSGRSVVVEATERWVDTGIDVREGETLSFQAEGTIELSSDSSDKASPSGSVSGRRAPEAPLRQQRAGALIARIGNSDPIFVGGNGTIERAPESGRLYLSVNDDYLGDNRGQFRVSVMVGR